MTESIEDVKERRARPEGSVHPYLVYLDQRFGTYRRFFEREGVPVITGHFVRDVRTEPVFPWPRVGAKGVYLNLSDPPTDDAHILEIPPGGQTEPQRHLWEQVSVAVAGHGVTSLQATDGGPSRTFEWGPGSVFAVPLNVEYRHFNGDGRTPARLLTVTMAPLMMTLFNDVDFLLNNSHWFKSRFEDRADYLTSMGLVSELGGYGITGGVWETNLIPDIRSFVKPERLLGTWSGVGFKVTYAAMGGNTMWVHLATESVGTYRCAHRHGPGAHVFVLDGQGFSVMWQRGGRKERFDWHEGSVLSPPAGYFHQHFNTGAAPVLYLGLHHSAAMNGPKEEREQIPYDEEDPEIRAMFEEALAAKGLKSRMDPGLYKRAGQ